MKKKIKPFIKKKAPARKERRRSPRQSILEAFQIFVVIPTLGSLKVKLRDVSEHGLAFHFDPSFGNEFVMGSELEVFLYLNLTLRIPLVVKLIRNQGEVIGCEVSPSRKPNYVAYSKFVSLLDKLVILEASN